MPGPGLGRAYLEISSEVIYIHGFNHAFSSYFIVRILPDLAALVAKLRPVCLRNGRDNLFTI